MKKVKLGMIKIAQEATEKLLTADLPVKTAWKLKKAFNVLKKELEDIEEMRVKLVQKHGEKDKDGNVIVKQEKLANFLNDFNPLLEQEIELNYDAIPISEIMAANINFSTVQLAQLEVIELVYDDTNEVKEVIEENLTDQELPTSMP